MRKLSKQKGFKEIEYQQSNEKETPQNGRRRGIPLNLTIVCILLTHLFHPLPKVKVVHETLHNLRCAAASVEFTTSRGRIFSYKPKCAGERGLGDVDVERDVGKDLNIVVGGN